MAKRNLVLVSKRVWSHLADIKGFYDDHEGFSLQSCFTPIILEIT